MLNAVKVRLQRWSGYRKRKVLTCSRDYHKKRLLLNFDDQVLKAGALKKRSGDDRSGFIEDKCSCAVF